MADAHPEPVYVLGGLGPGPGGAFEHAERVASYAASARALLDAGVDALLLETVAGREQLAAAVEGCARALDESGSALPLCVSLAVDEEGRCFDGASPADCAQLPLAAPVALWGTNCGSSWEGCLRALDALEAACEQPLGLWPNAGRPEREGEGWSWPWGPAPFAQRLSAQQRPRLRLLGGCCGTTPAHLAALGRALPAFG